MKEMYIPCSTAQEKQEVIKHLVSIGYQNVSTDDEFLNINAYHDGDIISVTGNTWGFKLITPFELLNKQEPTMNKLKEAVQNSGLNKSELSRRLGKHHNYLNVILRDGCSTKKQNELIEMINQVEAGERFKSDDEIIADLSEQLEKSQQLAQHNADCAHNYLAQLKEQQEITKDKEAKLIQRGDEIKRMTARSGKLAEENIQITNALNNERKTSQNQAQRILELEAIIAPQNKEITELRATNAKYEDELTKAGRELINQDMKISEQSDLINFLETQRGNLLVDNHRNNAQRKSYMSAFFMLLSLVVICLLWSAFKLIN